MLLGLYFSIHRNLRLFQCCFSLLVPCHIHRDFDFAVLTFWNVHLHFLCRSVHVFFCKSSVWAGFISHQISYRDSEKLCHFMNILQAEHWSIPRRAIISSRHGTLIPWIRRYLPFKEGDSGEHWLYTSTGSRFLAKISERILDHDRPCAWRDCSNFLTCRRYWHDEYYACDRNWTNAGNWNTSGNRRTAFKYCSSILDRIRYALRRGWNCRNCFWNVRQHYIKPIDVSNNNSPDAVDYRCGIFAERYARCSLWQLSSS